MNFFLGLIAHYNGVSRSSGCLYAMPSASKIWRRKTGFPWKLDFYYPISIIKIARSFDDKLFRTLVVSAHSFGVVAPIIWKKLQKVTLALKSCKKSDLLLNKRWQDFGKEKCSKKRKSGKIEKVTSSSVSAGKSSPTFLPDSIRSWEEEMSSFIKKNGQLESRVTA